MSVNSCRWTGVSGWPYNYEVHPFGTPLANVPGNYLICRLEPSGHWTVLYAGEAESLANRCNGEHEKWFAAAVRGATHIHAKITYGGKSARCTEETDLRRAWNPPLNDQ